MKIFTKKMTIKFYRVSYWISSIALAVYNDTLIYNYFSNKLDDAVPLFLLLALPLLFVNGIIAFVAMLLNVFFYSVIDNFTDNLS